MEDATTLEMRVRPCTTAAADAFWLVVAFAQSHPREAEPFVQRQCRHVVDSDFQKHAFGALPTRRDDQYFEKRRRYPLPLVWSADADRHDFRIITVIPETGIAAHDGLLRSETICTRPICGRAIHNTEIINIEQIRACRRVEFLTD